MAENTLPRQFDVAKLREDLYMLEHAVSPSVREVARFQLTQLLDWLDDKKHTVSVWWCSAERIARGELGRVPIPPWGAHECSAEYGCGWADLRVGITHEFDVMPPRTELDGSA